MIYRRLSDESLAVVWRSWERKVDDFISQLQHRLFSQADFDHSIRTLTADPESPFSAATITIHMGDPFDDFTVGQSGVGDADSTTINLGEARIYARVMLWNSSVSGPADRSSASMKVNELVRAFWRADGRDRVGGILSSQRDDVQRALENTIAEWVAKERVAIIFGDIDHFKSWNDQRHQVEGDRLIRKLAAALLRRTPSRAVVVRRGGDEFLVVMPVANPAEAIEDIIRLRVRAESDLAANEQLLEGPEQIGLALGAAFIAEAGLSYDEMELRADNALKPRGIKQRGHVSIEESISPTRALPVPAELCPAVALSSIGIDCPFANVWLSYVSSLVEQAARHSGATDRLSALVDQVSVAMRAVAPHWTEEGREAIQDIEHHPLTGRRSMSALDVASAVAHGLARSSIGAGEWEIRWSSGASAAKVLHTPSETVIFEQGNQPLTQHILVPTLAGEATSIDARRVILVQIGLNRLDLPDILFAETVYVDDRPTSGGGLPDLWEAALAQIVASLARLPNVSAAIIAGDPASGASTINWLKRSAEWSQGNVIDELADKLGTPTYLIREAGNRLAGCVQVVAAPDEATRVILGELRKVTPLRPTPPALTHRLDPPLRRSLNMEGLVLGNEDGCRVATAYEAFPIALDIVRQHHQKPLQDQLNRLFTELSDFRILLTNPTVDTIPRYHLSSKETLAAYFEREFCDPNGKFRSALDANEQLTRVLDHVAGAVGPDGYATRRALLVVPHVPAVGGDLAPLGLVSIRINPTPHEGGTILRFSFTWRTVEALVGLPYSLYGSIRFGQYLTEQVRERIGKPIQNAIRMGELSYIAHSLHMYLDEYAENVARLIVNDATQ